MRALQLANQYMEIFYGDVPLDDLHGLLSENFRFEGPFYQFSSKAAYIEALKADPPVGCTFELIYSFENANSACLIYRFEKPGVSALMSQLFETDNDRITKIVLIFDSAGFH